MHQFSQIYNTVTALGYCSFPFSILGTNLGKMTKFSICITVKQTRFGLLCVNFSIFTTQNFMAFGYCFNFISAQYLYLWGIG